MKEKQLKSSEEFGNYIPARKDEFVSEKLQKDDNEICKYNQDFNDEDDIFVDYRKKESIKENDNDEFGKCKTVIESRLKRKVCTDKGDNVGSEKESRT